MQFPEFERVLGSEPSSQDPRFLAARHSSPQFEEAARCAERFERKLRRAFAAPLPSGLLDEFRAIPKANAVGSRRTGRNWVPLALAASLLLSVTVGILVNANRVGDSVEDYLVSHYAMDGARLEGMAEGHVADNVQLILAGVDYEALPELASIVGYIKYCPTPDGRGVHMVLHTNGGPVTVILMPETQVIEGEKRLANGMRARLVSLSRGSIAVVGTDRAVIRQLSPMLRASVVPAGTSAAVPTHRQTGSAAISA